MFYDHMSRIWLAFSFVVILCELYVPYRKSLFLSLAAGGVGCVVYSEYVSDVFMQCAFFIVISLAIYTLVSLICVLAAVRRAKSVTVADVIALGDICDKGYGAVYYRGKSYIIKNKFGKNIRKGEVFRMYSADLVEDKDV